MSTFQETEQLEYQALMASSREASRTGLVCWLVSGVAASAMLAWGLATKSPALMLPVLLATAYGYYANLRSRHHVRLVAGYLEEFYEDRGAARWFTRLRSLESSHAVFAHDWVTAALANGVVLAAVATSWLFAEGAARGDLMAGIVTGCGIVFAWHSTSETSRLRATDVGASWHQAGLKLRESPRRTERAAA